jgi:hypothetical protein
MSKRRHAQAAEVVREITHDPARGDIFWFLYREFEVIRAESEVRRISWKAMAAKVARLGLEDGAGNVGTGPRALRKTFDRVCDLKRREAAAKQKNAAVLRRPTSSPPPAVQPMQIRPWDYTKSEASGSSGSDDQDDVDPLIRQIRKRSGWRV